MGMFLDKKSGNRTSSSDLITKQLSKAQFVRKMQEVGQADILPSKQAREGEGNTNKREGNGKLTGGGEGNYENRN